MLLYIKFQNHKKKSLETKNYLNIPFMVLKIILLPVIGRRATSKKAYGVKRHRVFIAAHTRPTQQCHSTQDIQGTAGVLAPCFPFMDAAPQAGCRNLHTFWILLKAFNRIL